MKKTQNLEEKTETICSVKYKSGKRIFWKKDPFLDGKNLKEIENYLKNTNEERKSSFDSYSIISKIKEKKRKILYTFLNYPGLDSQKAKMGDLSPIKIKYKIVPKLNLK